MEQKRTTLSLPVATIQADSEVSHDRSVTEGIFSSRNGNVIFNPTVDTELTYNKTI